MNTVHSVYSHSRIVPKDRALCNSRNFLLCLQSTGYCCFCVTTGTPNPIKKDATYQLWNLVSNGLISTDPNDPSKVLCNGGFAPATGAISKNVVTLF